MDAFWVLWNWWGNCSLVQSIAGAKESTLAACRGEEKFPPARLPDSMPGRRLCLAAVYYNRIHEGRNSQNGNAESRVLVSEHGAPDGVSALLNGKVSQSSPVLHLISPQRVGEPACSVTPVMLSWYQHFLPLIVKGKLGQVRKKKHVLRGSESLGDRV